MIKIAGVKSNDKINFKEFVDFFNKVDWLKPETVVVPISRILHANLSPRASCLSLNRYMMDTPNWEALLCVHFYFLSSSSIRFDI